MYKRNKVSCEFKHWVPNKSHVWEIRWEMKEKISVVLKVRERDSQVQTKLDSFFFRLMREGSLHGEQFWRKRQQDKNKWSTLAL